MENKNGQGIFYGVIGVATLVVAIIGATFAYFGASQTSPEGAINGTTLGGDSSVLTLDVHEVTFTGVTANHNLVPTNLTSATIEDALEAKCVGTENYTGCHVYEITATASDNVPTASLSLTDLTVTAKNTAANDLTDWNYAIFAGTVNTAGTGSTVTTSNPAVISAAFTAGTNGVSTVTSNDFWTGALDTTNSRTVTRYLIVWLADDHEQQDKKDSDDATASYTGTVTLSAGSNGQIKATFSA